MKSKKPHSRQGLPLSSEVHEDDGVDPREYFRAGKQRGKIDRKSVQLCRQVAEVLSYVFAGDCRDDTIRDLQVVSVTPAPDASQLLVVVSPVLPPDEPLDHRAILARLDVARGRLRAEVAAGITRKRAPQLIFSLIGYSGENKERP